jgi:transposase
MRLRRFSPASKPIKRMVRVIADLAGDWRRLDERIEALSAEIEAIARGDAGCERLMSVPGIGPIISSAIVAAIGNGDGFGKGRDFAAWLGLVPKQISTGVARSSARYRNAAIVTYGFCSSRRRGWC